MALAECCFNPQGSLGANLDLASAERRLDQILFNETQSRIVISSVPEHSSSVLTFCQARGVPAHGLGTAGGEQLSLTVAGETLRWSVEEIHRDWFDAIAGAVQNEAATNS